VQSDFGLRAGAVFGDTIVSDFTPNLACGAEPSARGVWRPIRVGTGIWTD
jgi:hypothetical protein